MNNTNKSENLLIVLHTLIEMKALIEWCETLSKLEDYAEFKNLAFSLQPDFFHISVYVEIGHIRQSYAIPDIEVYSIFNEKYSDLAISINCVHSVVYSGCSFEGVIEIFENKYLIMINSEFYGIDSAIEKIKKERDYDTFNDITI